MDLAYRAEEAGLNALPAIRQVLLDRWVLRFADGFTQRANSVTPLATGGDLPARIRLCIDLYARQNLPCLFRMPSTLPPDLGLALDDQGFGPPEGETRILQCSILPTGPLASGIEMTEYTPTPAWLDAQARINGDRPHIAEARRELLTRLVIPAAYAGQRLGGPDGPLVSLATIAIHDGLACINMVATDPVARRQGLAFQVVAGLMAWAKQAGAEAACLQVGTGNAGAIALYRRLGFDTDLYTYHYRRLYQASTVPNCSAASRA